jgi:hypothetical protein
VPPIAHRYIQLLFTQTGPLVIPPAFQGVITSRAGFDLAGFLNGTGLGPVVEANYFLAQNANVTTNGTSPNATTTPTPVPASGAEKIACAWGSATLAMLCFLGFAALV